MVSLLWLLFALSLPAAAAPQAIGTALDGRYWIDPAGQASVEQVAALPASALQPLEQRSFRLGPAALWLRLDLPAQPSGADQYLVLDSSAFTDRASLFQASPDGRWQG